MSLEPNSSLATAPEEPGEEPARFFRDMADGLHALAQPLTILRGALAAITLHEEIDPRHYVEMSARQVDRLCEVMASLQHLLVVKRYEPKYAEFDLWSALSPMIEDRKRELEAAGVQLTVLGPSRPAWVCGDEERTEQAVLAVLNVACAAAAEGDAICLAVELRDEAVEIVLEDAGRLMRRLSAQDRLCLSSAEANVRSQHGSFAVQSDPPRIVLALPSAEPPEETNLSAVVDMTQACRARNSFADQAAVLTNFSFEAGD